LVKDTEMTNFWSKALDLDWLAFDDSKTTNKEVNLPQGSKKVQKQGYEEIYIPALKHQIGPDEKLIKISSLPDWVQIAFPGHETLNRI